MSGHGIWGTARKVYQIEPGCAFCVPKGIPHWMINTHPTENIEVVGFYPEVTRLPQHRLQIPGEKSRRRVHVTASAGIGPRYL